MKFINVQNVIYKKNKDMKKLSMILFAILMVENIQAQVAFYQGSNKLKDGDTITVNVAGTDESGELVMESELRLKNESSTSSNIVCSQDVVTNTVNGKFQFCLGNCTIGTKSLTQTTANPITAGNFVGGFGVEYYPEEKNYEKAMATYIANLVGSTQKTKVTVIFNYQSTTGINIIQTNKVKVYSTKEFLILRCPVHSAKSITIYDVSGKIIAHYNLYGSLDEYTLPKVEKKGLYLFSVNMIDGKKIAGKFFSYAK